MSRSLALLVSCLALGLVVAGCGGDDEKDSGGEAAKTTEQPAEDTTGSGGAGGATAEVGMKGIQFDPAESTVKVGGTVKWTNNESVAHDVTKEDGPGPAFSSGKGNMQEGDTYEQTLKEAGKVNYVCTVHPNMKGTVTVE